MHSDIHKAGKGIVDYLSLQECAVTIYNLAVGVTERTCTGQAVGGFLDLLNDAAPIRLDDYLQANFRWIRKRWHLHLTLRRDQDGVTKILTDGVIVVDPVDNSWILCPEG